MHGNLTQPDILLSISTIGDGAPGCPPPDWAHKDLNTLAEQPADQ